MRGLMMDSPLLISSLIEHAGAIYGDREVVTRTVEGPVVRATYAEVLGRSKQLANALAGLGIARGDRVGTIAWNTQRHLEIYFGVSGYGAVCHAMNPRLHPDQLAWIIDHAEDRLLLVDITFLPLIEAVMERLDRKPPVVVLTAPEMIPETRLENVMSYEALLGAQSAAFAWPKLDENDAAGLCYTSGTTGHPKGVLYSHRSTVLHAMAIALPDVLHLAEDQAVLPVVPMFHVNAWGIPYAAPMTGAKLVMPGPGLDGRSLLDLMDAEAVTIAAGVPTIWHGLLAAMREEGRAPRGLHHTIIGGSAPPPSMIREFEETFGVEVRHGWGMTEMSPVGAVCKLRPDMRDWPAERRLAQKARQGRALYGVELEIFDDAGAPLRHDGETAGTLKARGPWICAGYFRDEAGPHPDGWLDTGDIATIDPHGYVQIVDRAKDMIRSGGEWISSIEIENLAVGHADIAMAAVIAVADEKWGERPLLIAVPREGARPTKESVLAYLGEHLANWQVPDDVVFVDSLPIGATGKVLKTRLREQYGKRA